MTAPPAWAPDPEFPEPTAAPSEETSDAISKQEWGKKIKIIIREIKNQPVLTSKLLRLSGIFSSRSSCVSAAAGAGSGAMRVCVLSSAAPSTRCFLSWRAEAAKLKRCGLFFGKRRSLVGAGKGLRLHDEGGRRSRAASFPDDTNSRRVRVSI